MILIILQRCIKCSESLLRHFIIIKTDNSFEVFYYDPWPRKSHLFDKFRFFILLSGVTTPNEELRSYVNLVLVQDTEYIPHENTCMKTYPKAKPQVIEKLYNKGKRSR